jgi:hypothetical protein
MTARKEFPSVAKITQTGTDESGFARFSAARRHHCGIEPVFHRARMRTIAAGAVLSYLRRNRRGRHRRRRVPQMRQPRNRFFIFF